MCYAAVCLVLFTVLCFVFITRFLIVLILSCLCQFQETCILNLLIRWVKVWNFSFNFIKFCCISGFPFCLFCHMWLTGGILQRQHKFCTLCLCNSQNKVLDNWGLSEIMSFNYQQEKIDKFNDLTFVFFILRTFYFFLSLE